jgi:hypothetical protein
MSKERKGDYSAFSLRMLKMKSGAWEQRYYTAECVTELADEYHDEEMDLPYEGRRRELDFNDR